jgi:tricorn protease
VHLAPADGGDGKRLTSLEPCQIKSVQWSPDGKWLLVYTSEMKFRLVDAATGQDNEVAHFSGSWFAPPVSFSPDSKWIAFVRNAMHTQINRIELYELASGKTTVVSDGSADDSAVAFSTDGKFLAFVSRRALAVSNDPVLNQLNLGQTTVPCVLPLTADTESPFTLKDPAEEAAKPAEKPAEPAKPDETKKEEGTKIDLEGLYGRRVEVPMPPGAYTQIAMVKGRILVAGGGQIQFYDYQAKRAGVLTQGGNFQLNKDGTKALVGGRVIDTAGENVPLTTGALSFGGLKLRIEPLAEWRQIFWDAWRLLRDYFYVANMHGLDWKAVGAKYAALLPSVRSRTELDDLIRWMQAELGSSHQYLDVGDTRDIKPRVAPAYLGLDYESSPDGLRIAKVVRGDGFRTGERSPLADPALKVKEGMYVVRVAGQPVASELDVNEQLLGRAGQVVGVTVNDKPGADGARTVYVRPVANERRMRYLEWVEGNRKYVERASGGRVGYLHLAAMSNEDMSDFVKQYFPQQDKDALLVDVRFNNGGYIQTMVNNVLDVHVSGYFNMRESREPWSRQWDGFIGPQACLINEFSISCGEEFPHRFKDLGIGPLIGRRTMGGEVGSSPGWPLMDGGIVSVPNYGMFTMKDGWVIEGAGVSPDIDVASDPNAFVGGKDAQLDAGVKNLLEALKKRPVVRPQPPADRVRTKG